MTLYIALVAILNLGLGYALAVFLRRGQEQVALETSDVLDETESEEWES